MRFTENIAIPFLIGTLLFLFLLFFSKIAFAQEVNYYSRAGAGFTNNVQSGIFGVGRDAYLGDNWFYRSDLGFWTDSAPRHRGSIYAGFLFGKRVGDLRDWHLDLSAGPMFIGSTDENLGSAFQITQELWVGYQNLSVGIKHISNAGIVLPNRSRDYIMIQWTVPIWE